MNNRETIADFFTKAGGVQELARRIGVSPNALYLNKSREYLSRAHKYEMMIVAKKLKFKLPDNLFDPVKKAA